ncbi:hypothetical protein K501DRAFT_276298 [Backusella circina FSU 941]|nr:hypothetical protein K501DRAFT_276298 [Backusella circina FSU 941]
MSETSASKYYTLYSNDPDQKIPVPGGGGNIPCSQDQINKLVGYIVDDKISLRQASLKASMSQFTGTKYYSKYIHHPDREIPKPLIQSATLVPNLCTRISLFFQIIKQWMCG